MDIASCTPDSLLLNLPADCQITSSLPQKGIYNANLFLQTTFVMQHNRFLKTKVVRSVTHFCSMKKIKLETSTFSLVNVKVFYFHLLNISVCKRLLIPYSFQGRIIDTSNYTAFLLILTGQNPGNRQNPHCVCLCEYINSRYSVLIVPYSSAQERPSYISCMSTTFEVRLLTTFNQRSVFLK